MQGQEAGSCLSPRKTFLCTASCESRDPASMLVVSKSRKIKAFCRYNCPRSTQPSELAVQVPDRQTWKRTTGCSSQAEARQHLAN